LRVPFPYFTSPDTQRLPRTVTDKGDSGLPKKLFLTNHINRKKDTVQWIMSGVRNKHEERSPRREKATSGTSLKGKGCHHGYWTE
jgi:hypothetical protein